MWLENQLQDLLHSRIILDGALAQLNLNEADSAAATSADERPASASS